MLKFYAPKLIELLAKTQNTTTQTQTNTHRQTDMNTLLNIKQENIDCNFMFKRGYVAPF